MKHYSGNTPMVEIVYRFDGHLGHIYAKLEQYNPSGSIKDRIAEFILDRASEKGELKDGQPIVETTSGNTGIAIAAYGALKSHPVHIFMPDWTSIERVKLMQMFGAEVHLISEKQGGFLGCLKETERLTKELGAFRFNQFSNKDNMLAHYNSTGAEILRDLPIVTDFVSGVGSGGTLMGTGKKLMDAKKARLIAIEPDCAQTLAGKKATRIHKIEGISDGFIPEIYDAKLVSEIIPINDEDAIAMSSRLAKELGLGVGISSGANFLGAVLADKYPYQKVATVFADDNKKYLSTSLATSPKPAERMISSTIELVDCQRI